ncbi:MAG TPA: hypothetical protein VE404_07585, partial [Verrucomicrobiae bacterium]|nr:hypothetical protein [Verrucomicrobiae bacterium]
MPRLLVPIAACLLAASTLSISQTKTRLDPTEGFTVSSEEGDYSMTLGFYTQTRLSWAHVDVFRRADPTLTSSPIPVENIGGAQDTFAMRRARLFLKGAFY